MHALLNQIRSLEICKPHLPHQPNPVLAASAMSRIAIVGQTPVLYTISEHTFLSTLYCPIFNQETISG
ncbi:MAG: hypothetical protein AAFR37_14795 [Cyanobacteria bacterium J06628_3]